MSRDAGTSTINHRLYIIDYEERKEGKKKTVDEKQFQMNHHVRFVSLCHDYQLAPKSKNMIAFAWSSLTGTSFVSEFLKFLTRHLNIKSYDILPRWKDK